MGRLLSELAPAFRPKADEFLARLTEAGLPVMIVTTGRTAAEQADAVKRGVSKVAHSRHQDGCAMDVAPLAQFTLHGSEKLQWDGADPAWQTIGHIAESLGLRWGGRFGEHPAGAGNGWDPGHVEVPNG